MLLGILGFLIGSFLFAILIGKMVAYGMGGDE